MSVTTSKLEDYNTEIHNVLTSGAKLERVYEGDWSAIANELEKSEQESEILPIVLELFNIEIDDPEVRTNHRVLLGAGHHQADIAIFDHEENIRTIIELKNEETHLESAWSNIKQTLDVVESDIATGILTNGVEFEIIRKRQGQAEIAWSFNIQHDSNVQHFADLLNRYVYYNIGENIRRESKTLKNQIEYFIRTLPFVLAADKQPAQNLDQVHQELIYEANFDTDTFSEVSNRMSDMIRAAAPALTERMYAKMEPPEANIIEYVENEFQMESRHIRAFRDIFISNTKGENIDEGFYQNLELSGDEQDSEFYFELADFIDSLNKEYASILNERRVIVDGGDHELTTVLSLLVSMGISIYGLLTYNIELFATGAVMALMAYSGQDQIERAKEDLLHLMSELMMRRYD